MVAAVSRAASSCASLPGRHRDPGPELAADAAALEAAPGCFDEDGLRRIDPDMAGFQRVGDPLGARGVTRRDGRDQAEIAVVGKADGFRLAREGAGAEDRS